jgi:hypothetical protein
VAVGATLTVWAFRICEVTVKLPVAISKLLLGQPATPFGFSIGISCCMWVLRH